jgi:hypothetical protein
VGKERRYIENRAAACGFDPSFSKQKPDEKYRVATDYLPPRTASPFGMGVGEDDRVQDEFEAWELPWGYRPPPPGASYEDRLYGSRDFLISWRSAGRPGPSMSNPSVGMGGGGFPGYQQYAQRPSMGNPYLSSVLSGLPAPGTPQFDPLFDVMIDDIREGRDHRARLRDRGISTELIDVIDRAFAMTLTLIRKENIDGGESCYVYEG